MRTPISLIEEKVYSLLDENYDINAERMEYCDPAASLSGLIYDLVEDAARVVLSSVPCTRINECLHVDRISESPTFISEKEALLSLPKDFLRMLYMRMSDWQGGIVTLLAENGEEASLRRSRAFGGYGRRRGAAAALSARGERSQLHIFGSAPGARLMDFDFLLAPRLENGYIDIPESLIHEVCVKTAEMVRFVIKE